MSDGRWRLRPGHADPVFIGGTGRSGTHAMARLLAKHPAFYFFRREMRFHTDPGGLPDLLARRITLEEFVGAMRGHFWRRVGRDGRTRGLHDCFEWSDYEAAVERFSRHYPADAHAASHELIRGLLDPLAREAGKATWIEQTPPTAARADTLHRIFPSMKLIHMVRDGRDVACSVARRPTGPMAVPAALERWETRLRAAHAATSRIPPDRVQVIHLEELVLGDRRRAYRRLMRFLGAAPERRSRSFLDQRMTAEAANVGRWRRDLSRREQVTISRLYRRSLEGMRRDGIDCAPSVEDAEMPAGLEQGSWLARARASLGRRQ